jgi:hypothetical protein
MNTKPSSVLPFPLKESFQVLLRVEAARFLSEYFHKTFYVTEEIEEHIETS